MNVLHQVEKTIDGYCKLKKIGLDRPPKSDKS